MNEQFNFTAKLRSIFIVISLTGLILTIIALFATEPTKYRIWGSFLVSNMYYLLIGLSGIFFVALQYVASAGWATVLKRIHEAMSQYVYFAFISMLLIIIFGIYPIYHHWADAALLDLASEKYDAIIVGKSPFLNIPFFTVRFFLIFAIFISFIYFFRRMSLLEDINGGLSYHKKGKFYGTIFLLSFGVFFSLASFDWIMTIDAHWYSTIFGVYIFAGLFVSGIAVTILSLIFLKSRGYLTVVNTNHFHDLGKFMFAFSVFWAYIWFSQFMLIWYGNLPEENIYYIQRMEGNWMYLFLINPMINFIIPFFVLMMSDAKRNIHVLGTVAAILLMGRFLDLYLMVLPGVTGAQPQFGILEVGYMLLFGGIFLMVFFYSLSKANLIPVNHPYLDESKHHEIYP